MTWRDRWHEWQALDSFVREHEQDLVEGRRMRGMTICQQRTWQDMMRLRKESVDAESEAGDSPGVTEVREVQGDDAGGDDRCEGPAARGREEQQGA